MRDYAAELGYTLSAPARTPPAAVAAIEVAAREAMNEPAFTSALMERGFDPEYLGRADLEPALEADHARWAPALRRVGLSAD